jgi:threonine dehydrogenase-like Zn-dependent dehydrogenase
MPEYSVSPTGEKFAIPGQDEYAAEFERIKALVDAERDDGKEIVVVMGVGFVGAVMAAIVADTGASLLVISNGLRLLRA